MANKTSNKMEKLWQKIAIITSCLAVGTSASVGIVNHESVARYDKSVARSDANSCSLKSFLIVISARTKESPRPGSEDIVKKYNKLVTNLKPELKDCSPEYVIK